MFSFSHIPFWSVGGMVYRAIQQGKISRAKQIIRRGIEIGAFDKTTWKTAAWLHTDISRKPRAW